MAKLNYVDQNPIYTVRQARKLADLTQREVAKALGINRATYIAMEQNPEKITVPQAKAISKITEVPFDQIFFGDESTKSRENAI